MKRSHFLSEAELILSGCGLTGRKWMRVMSAALMTTMLENVSQLYGTRREAAGGELSGVTVRLMTQIYIVDSV